jgi:hypothetical protein
MASKRPVMTLSRDEEIFLRHWMYEEVNSGEGQGPAKRLQVQHRAVADDLAVLIAAAMPDPANQDAAGQGPPPKEPPIWPWPGGTLWIRVADARAYIMDPQDYSIGSGMGNRRCDSGIRAVRGRRRHQFRDRRAARTECRPAPRLCVVPRRDDWRARLRAKGRCYRSHHRRYRRRETSPRED